MGFSRFDRPVLAVLALVLSAVSALASPSIPPASRTPAKETARRTPPDAWPVAAAVPTILDLQKDLAQLGYLPVAWHGASFHYLASSVPPLLVALLQPGAHSVLLRGALMTFEADHGLPLTASPTRAVWRDLQGDIAAGRLAPHPFTYVYVDTTPPERIFVWTPSTVLIEAPANTGAPPWPTPAGTYPVYLRLPFQVMRGKNPDGTRYADPVRWISYFYGGDAVHGFERAAYGFPQSLGCIEVPLSVAQAVYDDLQIGTLVTVSAEPFMLVTPPLLLRH